MFLRRENRLSARKRVEEDSTNHYLKKKGRFGLCCIGVKLDLIFFFLFLNNNFEQFSMMSFWILPLYKNDLKHNDIHLSYYVNNEVRVGCIMYGFLLELKQCGASWWVVVV